jgi:2-methoxy-6-polyprenyl-1,4-benzoquinol methylase
MNDAMSFGLHRLWKNYLIQKIEPLPTMKLLDVAGGTGDIAFRYLNSLHPDVREQAEITICDINQNMLNVGKERYEKLFKQNEMIKPNELAKVNWRLGNAENLVDEKSNYYDVYTIAFGIRNCTHLDKVIKEAYRVLKPGGRFICMEFSQVENELFQK